MPAPYLREQNFWDGVGEDEYRSLSPVDQRRVLSWIAWPGQGRVLDLGGGSGMVGRLLQRAPGTRAVCLDISRRMLAHAPLVAVQADALALPFADGSFALVVAAALFHHLPDRIDGLLAECRRVLAPGGRLVGYDPNAQAYANRIFMGSGPLRLGRFSPDERPLRPQELGRQAEALGFERFGFEYFSFRYERVTVFERIQRHLLSPLARGPLRARLERWFFWSAHRRA